MTKRQGNSHGLMILFGAGFLEIVWAIALKARWLHASLAQRHRRLLGGGRFCMLSNALKSSPVGTAYPVWVGASARSAWRARRHRCTRRERSSPLHFGLPSILLVGIVGLKIVEA